MAEATRVWDLDYQEVIYADQDEAGNLVLTLPDGTYFTTGPEQAKNLRKALQRFERARVTPPGEGQS